MKSLLGLYHPLCWSHLQVSRDWSHHNWQRLASLSWTHEMRLYVSPYFEGGHKISLSRVWFSSASAVKSDVQMRGIQHWNLGSEPVEIRRQGMTSWLACGVHLGTSVARASPNEPNSARAAEYRGTMSDIQVQCHGPGCSGEITTQAFAKNFNVEALEKFKFELT